MYQSDKAHAQLLELANMSSKAGKEQLLREFLAEGNTCFRKACMMALDPFITFGMAKMPKVSESGTEEFNAATFGMLQFMRDRKLTGNDAKSEVAAELGRLTPASGALLKMIISGKLGGGFSANTINKIEPGAIFLFKMCLADKFNDYCDTITDEQWGKGVSGEVKEDGVRGVSMQIKDFHFLSRNGLPLNSDQELRDEVSRFLGEWSMYFGSCDDINGSWDLDAPMNLDCEMVEANDCFNDSVGSARTKDEGRASTLQVRVIDVLTQEEMDSKASYLTYKNRRRMLEEFFAAMGDEFPRIHLIEKFTFHSEQEVRDKFEEINSAGKEGLMIKLDEAFWEQKRIKGWLKVKGSIEVDLIVKSLEEGDENGKYKGLMGAAVCDYVNSKGKTVEVKIGGGWSLKQRAEFWAAFTGEPTTYVTTDKGVHTTHTCDPEECENPVGWMIEVKCHEETKDGSLRHPNFKRRRTDKPLDEGQGC